MKISDITILNDRRFLKAKGSKLEQMKLTLPDGATMTPITERGRLVGFKATSKSGKSQKVVHLHMAVKKAPKKPVKKPKPKTGTGGGSGGGGGTQPATCYYCRVTDKSVVCVEVPCT